MVRRNRAGRADGRSLRPGDSGAAGQRAAGADGLQRSTRPRAHPRGRAFYSAGGAGRPGLRGLPAGKRRGTSGVRTRLCRRWNEDGEDSSAWSGCTDRVDPGGRCRTGSGAESDPRRTPPGRSRCGFRCPRNALRRILMVVPDQNLLIVSGPNDVPYDFKVTPKTQIVSGSSRPTLNELKGQEGRSVVVEFVPERDGNYARRVEVRG